MTHSAVDFGTLVTASANHATSAVATITGVVGKKTYILSVTSSSDKAGGKVLIKDGSTTIWQDRVSNTCPGIYYFDGYLVVSAGATLTVTTDGTAECNSNVTAIQL
jgi:hypothetical protein